MATPLYTVQCKPSEKDQKLTDYYLNENLGFQTFLFDPEAEPAENYLIKAFIDDESGKPRNYAREASQVPGKVPLGTSSVVTSEFIPMDSGLQKSSSAIRHG